MAKKIAIITAILLTLLMSSRASAATDNTSQIPELNPFCWHKKDCQNIRKQFGGTGTGDEGFISNLSTAPCNGGEGDDQWGRCLPAGTTKTEISFGGKSEFSNVGEFIVLMYKYLLTIASIVAVVMVIVAGTQWITSGGNSEAIGSAKKRIGGALIGLFIAYMSFFVLNTINPALVNLRLPQVWLIKPQSQLTEFCSDIPNPNGKLKFALAANWDQPKAPIPPSDQRQYILPADEKSLICGSRYLVENGGESTCRGHGCLKFKAEGWTVCFDRKGDGTDYKCGDIRMGGKIIYTGTATALIGDFFGGALSMDWTHPPVNAVGAWLICREPDIIATLNLGKLTEITNNQVFLNWANGVKDNYFLSITNKKIDDAVSKCVEDTPIARGDVSSVVRGVVLVADMQSALGSHGGTLGVYSFNETHYLGKNGVDLGNYDFFEKNYQKINSKYFYTVEELKRGIRLNINADSILDVNAGTFLGGDQGKANKFYQRYLAQ